MRIGGWGGGISGGRGKGVRHRKCLLSLTTLLRACESTFHYHCVAEMLMKAVVCKVVIQADRRLHISIPEDVPPGPAEIALIIAPEAPAERGMTAGDLLRSPLCGIWKDRSDIDDSIEYACLLRAQAERRSRA
jgi:hypothetical protein